MNSGLNNTNSFLSQLTQAQMEEYQQQLRQTQFLNSLFSSNMKNLGLANLFPQFSDNQGRTQQQSDLLNFNLGKISPAFYDNIFQPYSVCLNDPGNQMNFAKLLQKSFQMSNNLLNPLLQNQLLYNFNLVPMQPIKSNNCQNPITVEDDEQQSVQKCHNQKCQNKGDRRVKSKKGDMLQFCEKCLRLYNRGNFCDFCEQVYSNGSYDQDEQGWIQCDECEKWNHINCEAKCRNSNIKEEPENKVYYCLNCTKTMKKQQQQASFQQQKKPKTIEEYQPKQKPVMELEDARNREKNINFVATKDNKIQYTFRLNLYDDEIKSDLDFLRNSGKKIVKKPSLLDSPLMKQVNMQQQPQLIAQQEEKNSESQIGSSRLRTRNNKVKVNYRYLGGE